MRNKTAFITVKIAVVAPIPNASVRIAVTLEIFVDGKVDVRAQLFVQVGVKLPLAEKSRASG